jgi:hypothetical protein
MNAVEIMLSPLPRHALWRLSRLAGVDEGLAESDVGAAVWARFELDLVGLLNASNRAELDAMAAECEVDTDLNIGELRAALWMWGAELESPDPSLLGTCLQPVPVVLRGKLVMMGRGNGVAPPAAGYPRRVPEAVPAPLVDDEPDSVEQLLDAADRLVGVRLGGASRDKGAFGVRVAALLGVAEHGHSEPDWRGEVEIKTVPVIRDRSGWWRVKEDPAISMEHASPLAKLRRVLWIARIADACDSPILAWYYQEVDPAVREQIDAHLHTRPKGPKGTTARGWYLHKSFFAENGFLGALNG